MGENVLSRVNGKELASGKRGEGSVTERENGGVRTY